MEAAVDLMGLAGLQPAAVLCAVMKDDGTMARATDAAELAAQHGLDVVALEDIVALRQLRVRGAS
ncbi:3,4-dihydroxy-2-butanone-4-phosphate synthase [Hankyongella ginsenosidimutans]|uniref:3,4-dihydroxy-2-butanone-4-phosphate synthase n=1 Tax=Hankyongella ginsenosidimutans TaxID=1763828 RepID=UPI003CCC7D88